MNGSNPVERKSSGRTLAIVLGIVCILLAVGLVGAIANYTSIISGKDSTISSLQNQADNLTDIVNMAKSEIWVNSETVNQPAGGYYAWSHPKLDYAGYISIWVQSSTTTNTYVGVEWGSYGVNYNQQISVGSSGTAVFPVLPVSFITIKVGNSNLVDGATETVTITYHY